MVGAGFLSTADQFAGRVDAVWCRWPGPPEGDRLVGPRRAAHPQEPRPRQVPGRHPARRLRGVGCVPRVGEVDHPLDQRLHPQGRPVRHRVAQVRTAAPALHRYIIPADRLRVEVELVDTGAERPVRRLRAERDGRVARVPRDLADLHDHVAGTDGQVLGSLAHALDDGTAIRLHLGPASGQPTQPAGVDSSGRRVPHVAVEVGVPGPEPLGVLAEEPLMLFPNLSISQQPYYRLSVKRDNRVAH